MRVIIVGAGIIGITSAWYLTKAGYEVTVIDQASGPAKETSFANGGMLSVGHSAPNSKPGIIKMVLSNMFKRDSFLSVKPDFTWQQIRWGLQSLGQSTATKFSINQKRMINIAKLSRVSREEITAETGIEYQLREGGIMQICQNDAQLAAAEKQKAMLEGYEIASSILSKEELLAIEPGLKGSSNPIAGGIRLTEEKTGDCELFARQLAQKLKEMGVVFDYNMTVERIHHKDGNVESLTANGQSYHADYFVIAAGNESFDLLKEFIRIPLYPVKGFSLTLNVTDDQRAPQYSVFDTSNQIAITRFDDRVRIAGYAGIEGRNPKIDYNQVRILKESFDGWFPHSADLSDLSPWAGFRPMTPDGTPLISKTPLDNLYLNTGHGTYGWTMSCGSAKLLSELITGADQPSLDLASYSLNRYS